MGPTGTEPYGIWSWHGVRADKIRNSCEDCSNEPTHRIGCSMWHAAPPAKTTRISRAEQVRTYLCPELPLRFSKCGQRLTTSCRSQGASSIRHSSIPPAESLGSREDFDGNPFLRDSMKPVAAEWLMRARKRGDIPSKAGAGAFCALGAFFPHLNSPSPCNPQNSG